MQNQEEQTNSKTFRSLSDIREYKMELRKKIETEESNIASLWNELFHKEEEVPKTKGQKLAKMLSLGTGVFDGVMLGWKLYRRFRSGNSFIKSKRKK